MTDRVLQAVDEKANVTKAERSRLVRGLPGILAGADVAGSVPEGVRRIWGGMKGPVSIVGATVGKAEGGFCIGGGEYSAQSFVLVLLGLISPRAAVKVYVSEEVTLQQLEETDIILLGGPIKNRITREVLARLGKEPFRGHDLRRLNPGRTGFFHPKPKWDGMWVDFGYILIKENALCAGRRVFVLAGCYTPGTRASAGYVTSMPGCQELDFHYRDSEEIEAIVRIAPSLRGKEWLVQCVEPFEGEGISNDLDFFRSMDALKSGRYARVRSYLEKRFAESRNPPVFPT